MSDQQNYSSYYNVGMRVGVGIPLSNAEVFRDWAYIEELDEDLVTLQLSRDQLPESVRLSIGQILELRGGKDDNGYSCRAIIVSEGYAQELLLRLIGEVVSDELREFYRIDAFLPIKYYLSKEQSTELLEKEWRIRREERIEQNQIRKQKRWDSSRIVKAGALPDEKHEARNEEHEVDSEWDTIIPLAANISGGGLRLVTHQGFEDKEYLLLEILVPTPRRIVDAVARVVFARPMTTNGEPNGYFNTALQFVFIEESDRDAIVNHISIVQLKRIRQLRETYLFRDAKDGSSGTKQETYSAKLFFKRALIAFILITFALIATNYFRNYTKNKPKNEIEMIFEGGIKRYLEKQK